MGYKNTRAAVRQKPAISTGNNGDDTTIASTRRLVCATEQQQLLMLPRNKGAETAVPALSSSNKILSLRHPGTKKPARFYVDETNGIISEFTKIGIPSVPNVFKSWIVTTTTSKHGSCGSSSEGGSSVPNIQSAEDHQPSDVSCGYIMRDPSIYVATPFDPLFFLTPLIPISYEVEKGVFRVFDDHLEQLTKENPELWHLVLRSEALRKMLQSRMEVVSDSRQAGDEKVFRPSFDKFLRIVIQKAKRASSTTYWPKSMEREYVRRTIDETIFSTQPQNPAPSADVKAGSGSTIEDVVDQNREAQPTGDDVKNLQRLYVSAKFLAHSYVPLSHRESLLDAVYSRSEVDFSRLKEHFAAIEAKKAERQALRDVPMNSLNKRALDEVDDEIKAIQEAKRRRKEEDERKKTVIESRGIRDLKKADTSGMKKLSSFFMAKTPQLKNSKSVP